MREGAVFNPSSELAALGYLAIIAADDGEWDVAREYEHRARARLAELGFGSHRRSLPMLLARARLLAHDRDCSLDDLFVASTTSWVAWRRTSGCGCSAR